MQKKKKSIINLLLLHTFFILPSYGDSFLTQEVTRGRLGDQLVTYAKALYLSDMHKVPFFYTYFPKSELFTLSQLQPLRTLEHTFDKKIIINPTTSFAPSNDTKNTVYITKLHTHHSGINSVESLYEKMITQPAFERKIKKHLTPIEPITLLNIPTGYVTVALHIRKGGGYDFPLLSQQYFNTSKRYRKYADQIWPTKFPPNQFYIDQLRLLSELVDNAPIYVYLFTDDKDPAALAHEFQQVVQKPNIVWDFRTTQNAHNLNILDDLVHMTQFDCIIRAMSRFSQSAQLLGNHKIILYANKALWKGDRVMVNEVGIVLRNPHTHQAIIEHYQPLQESRGNLRMRLKSKISQKGNKTIRQFIGL